MLVKYLLYNVLFVGVFSKNYIITKNENTQDFIDLQFEKLAIIGSKIFYKSSHEQLLKNLQLIQNNYYIEEDAEIKINYQKVLVNKRVPWHLDRIVKRKLPLNNEFPYEYCNTDTKNYIIDTGIDITHSNFNGRAKFGANFINDIDTDENGHGTHCAGLIGSIGYGVCKDANLIAVKVLDKQGSGTLSGVIKGIEYVFNEYNKDKMVKSIISMSLGGGYSKILNEAVESCIEQSDYIYFVVASGNENDNSCNVSPASANGVISVMASDINDNKAWFSNFGKCSDIYSPGVDIISTIPNEKYASYSGTSMSTPQIAGVLNHYLNKYPKDTFKELKKRILNDSTKNVIIGNKKDTNNFLIYLGV